MKAKNLIVPSLIFGFILSVFLSFSTAAPKMNQNKKEQQPKVIIIPQEVKLVFEDGIQTREARTDIPFTIFKYLYLPQQNYMHNVFFFKVKNSDLGFVPVSPTGEQQEEKKDKEKEQTAFESAPTFLQAQAHLFLQFNQLDGEDVKEVYIPVNFQVDGISYDPDEENFYSVGFPLLPGRYLLCMAITSKKLEKIGTQYFECSPSDSASFIEGLETTPIFFVEKIDQMPGPDTKVEMHKGFFTYAVLRIVPNIDNIFSPGENLDVFLVVLGVQPDEMGQFDLDVNYEILKGEEKAIRYATQNYKSPLISQPLPMKRNVIIKSEEGETRETKDLEAGPYTLSIDIKDKLSGKTLTKTVDFEVR